jgi:hypothetical protein
MPTGVERDTDHTIDADLLLQVVEQGVDARRVRIIESDRLAATVRCPNEPAAPNLHR